METAVAEQAETASVGRDVAGDVAGALGAEVEGHHVAFWCEVVGQGLEDRAAVGGEDTCAADKSDGEHRRDGRVRRDAPETSSKWRTSFMPSVLRMTSS